ncbi:MAG: hypothetical protein ACTSWY_01525, partial [Promethearchaeota archaeon]
IGPEIGKISELTVDFGIFVLIGLKNNGIPEIQEKVLNNLEKSFSTILSNGIEGFMIRSIPRRFWCRITRKVIEKKFSFEILGNAIMFLYGQKFQEIIESMEILIISSNSELIEDFVKITSPIRETQKAKWKSKVEEWKKRVDCDYSWDCEQCPYIKTCNGVRELLNAREEYES